MAVPKEPPPIRVRSDLQASLAGWSFCPVKATFGSAHLDKLGCMGLSSAMEAGGWGWTGSQTLLASSCPASKGAETKATGSDAKRDE